MFDENQLVVVRWHSTNKQHFIKLGYNYTKIGDSFEVKAKHLPKNSSFSVKCVCDYCLKEFITHYAVYNKSKERGKVACLDCKQKKREDSFIKKYGANSPGASFECREKAKQVMKDKYGCEYALQSIQGQNNFKNSMIEKYGKDNPALCPDLLAKARITAYHNGTAPTSFPERKLVELLKEIYGENNCIASFPVDQVSLDCLLKINNIQIDIEYDGCYWHMNTKDKDRKRNHWLISKGYKIIRILGNSKDILPSKERIIEEVNYILEGHEIGYIDMNN